MEEQSQPELRSDSELRDLILRLLDRHSERKGHNVRSSDFDPPVSMHNICRVSPRLSLTARAPRGRATTDCSVPQWRSMARANAVHIPFLMD